MFLGRHPVVLKRLFTHGDDKRTDIRLRREVNVWKNLNHPRILPFIGLHTRDDVTYMVSPRMSDDNSRTYAEKHPDAKCLKILLQAAEGLEYLHNRSVVHGDICGNNILISASGDACIADFGLSVIMEEFPANSYSSSWHNGGHIRWKAPELLHSLPVGYPPRTAASDAFSFGRVIIELTTAQKPFSEIKNDWEVGSIVRDGRIPQRPTSEDAIARGLGDEVWALAEGCWQLDPALRPTADKVVQRLRAAPGGTVDT